MRGILIRYKRRILYGLLSLAVLSVYLFGFGGLEKLQEGQNQENTIALKTEVHYFERQYGEFCWGDATPLKQTIDNYTQFQQIKDDCELSFDYNEAYFNNNYLFFFVRSDALGFESHSYGFNPNSKQLEYRERATDPNWDDGETIIEFVEIPYEYKSPQSLEAVYVPNRIR